jgi:polysaccharide pyruvyl transferase WcaK-like protein
MNLNDGSVWNADKTAAWNPTAALPADRRLPGMQIVLVNVSPDSNRGSCALTWASLEFVFKAFPLASVAIVPIAVTPPDAAAFRHTTRRYPNVEILQPLFDGEGKRPLALLWRLAGRLREILRFDRERRNQNPTLEWIRNCDLAVSVGGVTFETCGGTLRDDARLVIRMLPLLAARKIDVPSVFVGAQVGPFNTRLGGGLFGSSAAKAAAVFPRDRVSASEVQRRLGQVRSILMPDSAFALELSRAGVGELFDRRGLDANAATLALVISSSLRPNERSDAHVALFVHVARRLVESGLVTQIVIVIQSDADRAISLDLARSLQLDPRFLVDDDLNPGELSNLYGACRMVVSSRLHAVILAMLAGVPAISLAPEVTFKEHSVLDLLGLESLCVPARLGPDRAAEICLDIAFEEDRHRRAVVTAVSAARTQLTQVPHHLREVVQEARAADWLRSQVSKE